MLGQLLASGAIRLAVLPITALCTILTARLTIEVTGVGLYGYINTIALLFQLLPFADLGVGAGVSNSIARQSSSSRRRHKAEASLLGAFRVLFLSGFALSLIALLLAATGLLPQILGIPNEHRNESSPVILICLLTYFFAVPFSLGQRMLVGAGRSEILATIGVITPIAILAYTWAGSLMDIPDFYFAVGPSIALLLVNFLALGLGFRYARFSFRWLLTHLPRPRFAPGGPVFDTALPMLVVSALFAITMQSHRLLLANLSSAGELAAYALVAQLFFPAWSVIYMAGASLWPKFATNERRPRLWIQANLLLAGIGFAAAMGLIILGPLLVSVMSDSQLKPDYALFLSFGLLLFVLALHATQSNLLVSGKRLRARATMAIVTTLVFFPLAFLSIPSFGASGPVIASIVAYLFCQTVPGLYIGYKITRTETIQEL